VDAGTFYAQLSLEQAPEIESDVLVGFTDGLTAQEAVESDLYSSVPAIEDDAAVVLDDQEVAAASSSVSVLSIPFVLDQLVDDLADAAAHAGA
jgi:iron complex transport system substrate-binding protein